MAELECAQTAQHTHAELEDLLERSRELMRTLLQDRLDLAAAREPRRATVPGADGVSRTRAESGHQRGLATMFGEVVVTRRAYRAPRAENLYPADGMLNLPEQKHSHGLRKLAAIESARGSFGQAAAAVERATGMQVGKRQVEQLAQAAAVDVDSFYAGRRPGPRPDSDLLLSVDGKGIVMRPGTPTHPPQPLPTGLHPHRLINSLQESRTHRIWAVFLHGGDGVRGRLSWSWW